MPPLPWQQIDSVLLDMDGTLLDLHFDNYFWLEHLPRRYAEERGIALAQAKAKLQAMCEQHEGQLNWYCTDFWSRELQLPIVELKREVAGLIALRPGADRFLAAVRNAGKQLVLLTNAHPDSLALKLQHIELAPYFERLISAHDYGFPKEDAGFWSALRQDLCFDPARSLFIDDNLTILHSAKAFGIAHLLAIAEPDSRKGKKPTAEFAAVHDYPQLLHGL
jgi:HAD superfamily hydrolase (TIGR01509 family)